MDADINFYFDPVWSVPAKVATAIKRRVRICL
jgi:hypothetical protein